MAYDVFFSLVSRITMTKAWKDQRNQEKTAVPTS